jgi:hypothetical protein
MQAGLSLQLVCNPSQRTEAILFSPVVRNFRDFRHSFKSFGVVTTD